MASLEFSKTMAIGEAERLWRLFGLTSPADLVLEDLAFARGVAVMEGPLDKMEARLVRQGKHGIIRVKSSLPESGRKRFAIAHELGHWELHGSVSQLFACTSNDMVASYKTSIHEAEANYFASGLLMPGFLYVEQAKNRQFCFNTLSDIAAHFGTSLTATAIRFVDATDDYLAIVASMNGKIQWWRGSSRFENRFWIVSGAQLSKNTVAAGLAEDSSKKTGLEEVDIDAWSERGYSSDSDVFVEESRCFAKYNQVLSLLRLP